MSTDSKQSETTGNRVTVNLDDYALGQPSLAQAGAKGPPRIGPAPTPIQTTVGTAWRRRQATPITIPVSLAYALWDLCCSRGRDEDAKYLMDAIEAAIPGYFARPKGLRG